MGSGIQTGPHVCVLVLTEPSPQPLPFFFFKQGNMEGWRDGLVVKALVTKSDYLTHDGRREWTPKVVF